MNARILVVDGDVLIRKGLIYIIQKKEPQWEFFEAADGRDAISKSGMLQPHLILMDHFMQPLNGVKAAMTIRKKHPSIGIIMVSARLQEETIIKTLAAGIKGFVPKDSADSELMDAIYRVLDGGCHLTGRTLEIARNHSETVKFHPDPFPGLFTRRETEILKLLVQGYTSRQIAEKLIISKRTVDHHRARLLSRTGTRTSLELIRFVMKTKMAEG